MDSILKVMFLGGMGEIGKNITVFEYGGEIVVVDCGMSFPTPDMPGIDIVIPDTTYLKENASRITGVLLTHGHEDHIGGVPYLIKQIGHEFPIFGSPLTLGLIEHKLREQGIDDVELVPVKNRTIVKLGCFEAEFVHVCHSVAGSFAIALYTPLGTVFHTGDFKIDFTPLAGEVMDLNRIAEIGNEGVLLMLSDSTNIERTGYTLSEQVVGETFKRIFSEAKENRIIVATFASNVDRVQEILDIAAETGRRVAVGGRSMLNVMEIAIRTGCLNFDRKLIIDIDKIESIPDNKLVILSTGTQGEPMSALTRMASNDYKVKIGKNDVIVISASAIPGNEKDIFRVINNLYRLGAKVIYSKLDDIHVSGHACQEELKLMLSLLKPRHFMPVHGEFRHLKQHAELAARLGVDERNIVVADIGDVIEVFPNKIRKKGSVQSGSIFVDGLGVGDVGNIVLRDRLVLSSDGMLLVVISISGTQGTIISGPEFISRGFIYTGDNSANDIVDEMKMLIAEAFMRIDLKEVNLSQAKTLIQKVLRGFLAKRLKRSPMIIPVVLQV